MLPSMAFSQADLDALDAAIKAGERSVAFGDRRVEYRDMSEMLKARALIVAELRALGAAPRQEIVGWVRAKPVTHRTLTAERFRPDRHSARRRHQRDARAHRCPVGSGRRICSATSWISALLATGTHTQTRTRPALFWRAA